MGMGLPRDTPQQKQGGWAIPGPIWSQDPDQPMAKGNAEGGALHHMGGGHGGLEEVATVDSWGEGFATPVR